MKIMVYQLNRCRNYDWQQNSRFEFAYPNDSILLKGQHRKLHRADIGERRIVYSVSKNVVMIETIDKQNDGAVYRF